MLLYWNAVPGSNCSSWPSALSAACCQLSTPWPKKTCERASKPDVCDINCRTVMVATRGSANGPSRPSWLGERFVEVDRALVDQLHDRDRCEHLGDAGEAEPRVDRGGLRLQRSSMPNAAVCSTSPSRITATPTDMSPTSTVAAAITVSKRRR